ncbi:MAG: response regulator transcription factor [Sulfuricurvum sp.]|uniref:response regulator transcription factor n=1 Tax=Sulfuricurvum sp. TaxID=2025608 RepID=UPI00261F0228|nr:response regulator transcription factor [Sulfuricurvum sp.]MDD2828493.1 response regulator transcription factor [Sulfuricurvum sp.]MDD4948976.1 response regulator transcription factor [Sulfuricurvum sp.]
MNLEKIYEQTRRMNVLFVEDDPQLRERTAEMLEDCFYRLEIAEDGVDALEKYKEYYNRKGSYFDIVISDIQMPRMDGVELTRELYALRNDQPIIILSAHTETDYLLALINLGVAQFVTKPIEYTKMLDVLYHVAHKINTASVNLPSKPSPLITISDTMVWDMESSLLLNDGNSVSLTKYEIYLMKVLSAKFEQVCSSDEIVNHFYLHDLDISSESLRGMMMRLRKKLPENALGSVYGLGYRLSSV